MNEGEKQRHKKSRGKKKTRGRLCEFKEEEVMWALAGKDGDKLWAEPLTSALSVRGHLTRTSGRFRKVIAHFGAAQMENASHPLAKSQS